MSMREMIVPYSPAAQRTKAKMLFGAKDDAAAAVEDLFVILAAEPDPVLDLLFLEGQFDHVVNGAGPSGSGRLWRDGPLCRSWLVSRGGWKFAREQLAQHVGDGDPAPKAATLMRPRSSGVMSMVRRAVNALSAAMPVGCGSVALIQLRDRPGRDANRRLSAARHAAPPPWNSSRVRCARGRARP
jgi:hypothetical protein